MKPVENVQSLNPFANYQSKLKEVERVHLSEVKIQSTIAKNLKINR